MCESNPAVHTASIVGRSVHKVARSFSPWSTLVEHVCYVYYVAFGDDFTNKPSRVIGVLIYFAQRVSAEINQYVAHDQPLQTAHSRDRMDHELLRHVSQAASHVDWQRGGRCSPPMLISDGDVCRLGWLPKMAPSSLAPPEAPHSGPVHAKRRRRQVD